MEGRHRSVLWITFAAGIVLVASTISFLAARRWKESDLMSVRWEQGIGMPLTVKGAVFRHQTPVEDCVVTIETGAGATSVTTDCEGKFAVNVGETELTAVKIEGFGGIRWTLLGGPDIGDGIDLRIELK